MMEWFELQPTSVAVLAEFILGTVLTIYILSIKKKSKDTWLFLAFVSASTIYYLIAFFYFSDEGFNNVSTLWWVHQVGLALFQLSILPFAYYFKTNPFPKESNVVFIVSALVTGAILIFVPPEIPLIWNFYFFVAVWFTNVFIRKAIVEQKRADHDEKNTGSTKASNLVKVFFYPANRTVKAFRAFALWGLLICFIWIDVNLMGMGVIPQPVWHPIHHTLILISIVWLVINYMNYASEMITFQVKLVALSLCVTLLLLGIMGFLLFHNSVTATQSPDLKEYILRILVLLILASSTIIMVVFPMIFRRNLLQPLEQVLTGVKKVNAGDLNAHVKVEVNDEIGVLGQQFNLMTDSLQNYSQHMEKLVEQRTEELESSLENLKSTQAQLIQSEKMASLGELTAGIAHEIQNPLNFVNNFSEVNQELVIELNHELSNGNLEDAIALANDIKENEEKINYHGKRADAIVKGMLQHSRASTGKKEPTDINALADEYLRLSYHGLRAKDKSMNATINTHLDEKIQNIDVITQDIGRVFLNLFTNAFHSVAEKKKQLDEASMAGSYEPTVTLITKVFSTHQDALTGVEIRVRDNGMGIPASVLDKVFQPFFSTRQTGQGTGLGLSISYDIINAHGGEINIATKEGEFAEFIVFLPYTSNESNNRKKILQDL